MPRMTSTYGNDFTAPKILNPKDSIGLTEGQKIATARRSVTSTYASKNKLRTYPGPKL